MRICFICHANICRSFAAERLIKEAARKANRLDIEVFSRGLYANPDYVIPDKIKDFLKSNGAAAEGHISTLVSIADLERADLVLVMTQDILDSLLDRAPQYTEKIFLLLDYAYGKEKDMPDPIALSGRPFEKIMTELKEAVEVVFNKIAAQ